MKNLMILGLMLISWIAHPTFAAASEDGWITIPAGGKPAYMGIHGGTMPVSLLVSNDGSSLFTFVGRTGNDFLDVLKKAYAPLPSLGNSTSMVPATSNRSGLFAGNSTASMPVLSLSQDMLAGLQPFGLSESPLIIEGQVARPTQFPHAKSFRLFSWPDYLKPRK